ncbi:hypothetical protein [Tersicoccus solisilvae]|nr:hypothetical protein [Tersicoccus solisilvae]
MPDLPALTVSVSAHDDVAENQNSTFLCPRDAFPDLEALSLTAVQALHSRVCRQLDREYLMTLDGPSCETLDRQQELSEELDRRELQRASVTAR